MKSCAPCQRAFARHDCGEQNLLTGDLHGAILIIDNYEIWHAAMAQHG